MPTDIPPPIVVASSAASEAEAEVELVYGPVDLEAPSREKTDQQECDQSTEGEIVVCAENPDEELVIVEPETGLPRAEIDIGKNATLRLRGGADPRIGGVGVMLEVKIKF